MSGRMVVMQAMKSISILTKNGILSAESAHNLMNKYLNLPYAKGYEIVEDLCGMELEMDYESVDIFSAVCEQLREI